MSIENTPDGGDNSEYTTQTPTEKSTSEISIEPATGTKKEVSDAEKADAILQQLNEATNDESVLRGFEQYINGVHPEILKRFDTNELQKLKDEYLIPLHEELSDNPELASLYTELIQNDNHEALVEKSEKQYQEFLEMYFGPHPWIRPFQYREKKRKLEIFEDAVNHLRVMASSQNLNLAEFKSARTTGVSNSFGPQDALIHADKYVYSSFDMMPHYMSTYSHQMNLLGGFPESNAHIVMQDFANICTLYSSKEGRMARYIKNMFDFQTGKKVVALYLASVFNSPEEAFAFIQKNNYPGYSRYWKDKLIYPKEYHSREPSGENTEDAMNKRIEEIRAKMLGVLSSTGIEPPLSLEVKIKDSAKVVGTEIGYWTK